MGHLRSFFVGCAAALCASFAAQQAAAQTSVAPQSPARVGWLTMQADGRYEEITSRGFIAGLREGGFVEGRNLLLVKRSADADIRRLRPLAREIVAEGVDVFFAPAKPMADAAWYASRKVPTVIATVTDPVTVEYAVSLAKPGKHITGVTTANAELIGKRMQLLAEMVPGLKRLGVFIDPALYASCSEEMDIMERAARTLGIRLVHVPVVYTRNTNVAAAIKRAVDAKVQAVVTAPMTNNQDVTERLAELAAAERLPFMHDVPHLAGEALAVYGPDFEDIFRRAGHYAARILKGEKPAEMAIEEPREFKLIVNTRVAQQLGLQLPRAVLVRANEVIQ